MLAGMEIRYAPGGSIQKPPGAFCCKVEGVWAVRLQFLIIIFLNIRDCIKTS